MWSNVTIPGRPTTLMVDASRNLMGWEANFCDQLYAAMARRNLLLKGAGPIRPELPKDPSAHMDPSDGYNCIIVLGRVEPQGLIAEASLASYLEWLDSHPPRPPKLLAVCSWEGYDPQLTDRVLESPAGFASLAVAQQSPVTGREAGLFLLKLFTELELHSEDSITGKMLWFSAAKARELLRKRRLSGKFGVRC